jgi:hypothetical protein
MNGNEEASSPKAPGHGKSREDLDTSKNPSPPPGHQTLGKYTVKAIR